MHADNLQCVVLMGTLFSTTSFVGLGYTSNMMLCLLVLRGGPHTIRCPVPGSSAALRISGHAAPATEDASSQLHVSEKIKGGEMHCCPAATAQVDSGTFTNTRAAT